LCKRVSALSSSKARFEEEKFKESIYKSIEAEKAAAFREVRNASAYFNSGKYEEQDAFLAAAPLSGARKSFNSIQQRNAALYKNTYFAHVEISEDESHTPEHYFLSNSEGLDTLLKINDGENTCAIVPFIHDRERPFLGALVSCYQRRNGDDFTVSVLDKRTQTREEYAYHPRLIRDVRVVNREIVGDIVTFYSASNEDDFTGDYDELFAQRLEENRFSPGLQNIIATLQRQQFDIINADRDLSFVVQGCAGSGKTQCLIHRLFYLRNVLQDEGWDKVLLITPTQVFRNYSADLMRRYRLDGVENTSIGGFYRTLLDAFDPRFRNRQYIFELSEEYLPDRYLHEVYAPANMMRIDRAIENAIRAHVESACTLLELPAPGIENIDIDYINDLAAKLTDSIKRFDETELLRSDDPEYLEHRKSIDVLDKELKVLHRKQDNLLSHQRQLTMDYEKFIILQEALSAAEAEAKAWVEQVEHRKDKCKTELLYCVERLNELEFSAPFMQLLAKYVQARSIAVKTLAPFGEQAIYDNEYLELLLAICEECKQELLGFTKKASPATWIRNHEKNVQDNSSNLLEVQEDIILTELYLEEHSTWLQEHNVEDAKKQRQAHRADLERARFYLSRIESSVFEQEVWNELQDAKKENGIETLRVHEGKDGHQRQSRILYKSDLLFYLKIYHLLHKKRILPDYRLICIDEGQDLHCADYELLRSLYPNIVMNVFGDVAQALHEECGISDWKNETGIEHVFILKSNYRNNAAIVDFCNNNFGSTMEYCGNISNYPAPQVSGPVAFKRALHSNNATVIVKDHNAFEEMCAILNISPDSFNYVDTKVDSITEDKIMCYSIFAAKGLEFSNVCVYANEMTLNQKMVACTRAMNALVYFSL